MNKHLEAAAAAYVRWNTNNHFATPDASDIASMQAAITAYCASLASAGEEAVVEAMRFAHSEYEDHKHGMRAALAVARAADAQRRAEAERKQETGWLVEDSNNNGGVRYRAMNGIDGIYWTTDPNEALRFARRVDAERFSEGDEDAWYVREHMWVDAARATEGGGHE